MLSRRPGARFNRGRIAAAGSLAQYDPLTGETDVVLDLDSELSLIATSSASITAGDDFSDAAWNKTNCSVAANADGSGDQVTKTGAAPQISQTLTNAAAGSAGVEPVKYSFKVKYVDTQWIRFCTNSANSLQNEVFFDIQNGVVGTTGSRVSNAAISAADGAGYRTVTLRANSTVSGSVVFRLLPSTTDTTVTDPADDTSYFIKEASVEQVRCSAISNRKSSANVSQGSAANQPGYITHPDNGRPTLAFYGAQWMSSMEAAVVSAFGGTDTAWTLMGAVGFKNVDLNAIYFSCANSGVATNDCLHVGTMTTGTGKHRCAKIDTGATNVTVESAADIGTNAQIVVEWFHTGTAVSCQQNGGAADPNAAAQDVGAINANRFGLGARVDSSPDTFAGASSATAATYLQKLIGFSATKDASSRSRVRQYIGTRFGIAVTP